MSNKVAQFITGEFVKRIAQDNLLPWQKPWLTVRAQNIISRKPYRGINVLLTAYFGNDDYFITAKQLAEANGIDTKKAGWNEEVGKFIKKGCKTVPIVFSNKVEEKRGGQPVIKGNGEPSLYWFLTYYRVFNLKDVTCPIERPNSKLINFVPHEMAEKLMTRAAIKTEWGGNRACYYPSEHKINLPEPERFRSVPAYYGASFHELGHAFAKELDPNLKLEAVFASDSYSREELVAELFANFCLSYCGIAPTFDNSAAYLKGWLERLNKDPRLLISAAASAQKRFDLLLERAGLREARVEENHTDEALARETTDAAVTSVTSA
jgi:antirestriction protein ArdC